MLTLSKRRGEKTISVAVIKRYVMWRDAVISGSISGSGSEAEEADTKEE